MGRTVSAIVACAAAAFLTSCALVPDGPLFDDAATARAKAEAAETALPAKVPVTRIQDLELGRLADGFMLTAFAVAPGTGYYQPELRPRFEGRPGPDGFLEYDFVIRPPENPGQGADAPLTARTVRGDTPLGPGALRSALGVRVWSARDSVEGRF